MWRMYYIASSLLLLGTGLLYAHYVGPTREGLSFHVSAVPSEIFLPNQVLTEEVEKYLFPTTATLTVHVIDVDQKPIKGVPVVFNTTPSCKSVATLTPVRAITAENGVVRATVESDQTTGVCRIAVQVDNITQMTRVTVSPAPEAPSADEGTGGEIKR